MMICRCPNFGKTMRPVKRTTWNSASNSWAACSECCYTTKICWSKHVNEIWTNRRTKRFCVKFFWSKMTSKCSSKIWTNGLHLGTCIAIWPPFSIRHTFSPNRMVLPWSSRLGIIPSFWACVRWSGLLRPATVPSWSRAKYHPTWPKCYRIFCLVTSIR